MKELTEKQFNRLTQVKRVEVFLDAFNRKTADIIDTYEYYRLEEESDEEARFNADTLSSMLSKHFLETHEILSRLEEAGMYALCQHFGATDPSFKQDYDEKFPAGANSYWTGKKLNGFKLHDVTKALEMIKEARHRLMESSLHALILK